MENWGGGTLAGGVQVGGKPLQKAAQQITRVDQALKLFYIERPGDLPLSVFWHSVGMACGILKTWYFLFRVNKGSLWGLGDLVFGDLV